MKKQLENFIEFLDRHLDTSFYLITNDTGGECNRILKYDIVSDSLIHVFFDFGLGEVKKYSIENDFFVSEWKKGNGWMYRVICDYELNVNPTDDKLEIYSYREEALQKLVKNKFISLNK